MAKCKRCEDQVEHAFKHGVNGYSYHKCRCFTCLTLYRRYNRERQRRDSARDYQKRYQSTETARNNRRARRQEGSPGFEYQRSYEREYSRVCRAAAEQRSKARRSSIPITRTGFNYWSSQEDRIAMQSELSITERASMLGRSYESVRSRLRSLREQGLIE